MIEVIAHSDVGIEKKINQDSISIKVMETRKGQCLMAVLCDGMGGLSEGELASTTCVKTFMNWFEHNIDRLIEDKNCFLNVQSAFEEMIQELNQRIGKYGLIHGIGLGTTLLAMLTIENEYLIVNVGDCRAYQMKDTVLQITRDHTVVAMEVEKGLLSPKEAETDKRRNILLQCIGASKVVKPEYHRGKIDQTDAFMLCSDGFRHLLSEQELAEKLCLKNYKGTANMQKNLIQCIDVVKSRGERDNITAMVAYFI